jgi:hypothetical protein
MSDPFDDLENDEDRDGDPFEALEDTAPGVPGASANGEDPGADQTDRTAAGVAPGEQVDVAGDPFGDVDVSRGDPFESADSPFQQVDVTGVDPDEVWKRFTDDAATSPDVEPPEDDVVVVSKHAFCEGCPYFSSPPEVECTHDGTTILEFVGPDEVRVENCPIVRERRELGEVHE